MNFNKHLKVEGQHSFLSASKYHWINYDEEKMIASYSNYMSAQKGTDLHAFASSAIRLGIRLPKVTKTLNMYVNDAIGYKMNTEQVLFYSDNCFGTTDAISFRKGFLRIHDLKNGVTPASIKQVEVYAALFCLEYGYEPNELQIELRIYQLDQVLIHSPNYEDIKYIMDKIIYFDKKIEEMKSGRLDS